MENEKIKKLLKDENQQKSEKYMDFDFYKQSSVQEETNVLSPCKEAEKKQLMSRQTENEKLMIKLKLVKNMMAQNEISVAKRLQKVQLETNRSAKNMKMQKPRLEIFNEK